MSQLRTTLEWLNHGLRLFNLRLDTLTRERQETLRLRQVEAAGGFNQPVYSVPPGFARSQHQFLLDELPRHRARFDTFRRPELNDVGFQFDNGFYGSPDAEVLYTMLRAKQPRRVLETGCGNSTKLIRQAIRDGGFPCEHVAIDPAPRRDISTLADKIIRQPIEQADAEPLVRKLEANDIFFIDTSHEVKPANDVAHIYGRLMSVVGPGAIVHIHDICIPYEYPRSWVMEERFGWGEQYLVHAMLMNSEHWEVLWPGHYLQRTLPDFNRHFPHRLNGMAQCLWLRKM